MKDNIISYAGKTYKFVANICNNDLANKCEESGTSEQLETMFANQDFESRLAELIKQHGNSEYIANTIANASEFFKDDTTNALIVVGKNVIGEVEYDLYEITEQVGTLVDINKACAWLSMHMPFGETSYKEMLECLDDFRKAMCKQNQ